MVRWREQKRWMGHLDREVAGPGRGVRTYAELRVNDNRFSCAWWQSQKFIMKHTGIKDIKCFFQQLPCKKWGQASHSSWRPEKNPFKGHKLENVLLILDLAQTERPLVWLGKCWLFNSSSAISSYLFIFARRQSRFSENLLKKIFKCSASIF